eukprot:20488-Heterococcus_DN1.PRE.4
MMATIGTLQRTMSMSWACVIGLEGVMALIAIVPTLWDSTVEIASITPAVLLRGISANISASVQCGLYLLLWMCWLLRCQSVSSSQENCVTRRERKRCSRSKHAQNSLSVQFFVCAAVRTLKLAQHMQACANWQHRCANKFTAI